MTNRKLPKGWIYAELGEVCSKPQYGWTTQSGDSGRLKYLRTTDISKGQIDWNKVPFCIDEPDDFNKYLLEENDIVVSRAGSVGLSFRVTETPFPTIFASYLIRFKPFIVNPKLIEYHLKSADYWSNISDLSAGIAVQNVNAVKLANLQVPLPPLPEQQRIVAKLDTLFGQLDRIKASMERIPQLLKDFRQKVLTQAVTGKLTEEWREGKELETIVKKLKLKEYTTDYRAGWIRTNISEVSTSISGFAFKSNIFADDGFQLIRMGNLYQDKLDLSRNPVFIPNNFDNKLVEKYTARPNSILLSLTGTKYKRDYGYAIKVPDGLGTILVNQRILNLIPKIDSTFFLYLLRSEMFRDQFFSFETGGVNQGNVGSKAVESIEMCIPSFEEQQEIVRRVESLFAKADRIEACYQKLQAKLEQLPQALLAKAFRGELVEQLPTDGAASDLLEQIKKLKLNTNN